MSDVLGTTLYDERYTLSDGTILHLVLDVIGIQSLLQDYTEALQDARSLPFDLQNLSPADPIIRYLIGLKKGYKDEEILARTRSYYSKQIAEAQTNAFMLSLFSSEDNVLTNVPSPYEYTQKALPGILQMPLVEKYLGNETEYRLKQLVDAIAANPMVLSRIQVIIDEFRVKFNRMGSAPETDKLGFHAGSTNQPVFEDTVADSV